MGKAKLTPCVWSVFVGERSSLQRIPRSAIGTARRRLGVSMSMMTGSVHTQSATMKSTTIDAGVVVTTLELSWPDEHPAEESQLFGMLIPVPVKLRLSAVRLRAIAHEVGQAVAVDIPALHGLEVHTSFCKGAYYRAKAYDRQPFFGTTPRVHARDALVAVCRGNRIGYGQRPGGGTSSLMRRRRRPNPGVLAVVRREAAPLAYGRQIRVIAEVLGAKGIT